jgi:hypothetical protein
VRRLKQTGTDQPGFSAAAASDAAKVRLHPEISYFILRFFIKTVENRLVSTEETMKNPLDSIVGTIIAGFVLTGILYFIVRAIA